MMLEKASGLAVFRDGTSDVCDVTLPGGVESFQMLSRGSNMGVAVLTEVRIRSMHFRRSSYHLARSGYDHYQIHLNLAGDHHVRSGRQSAVFRRGDIGILDTTRVADSDVRAPDGSRAHCLSLFVPRAMLARLFASPDSEHCAVLRGDTQAGRLLREQLIYFSRQSEKFTAAETNAAMQGLCGLIADGFGPATDATLPLRQAMRQASLASAKRYIERHLDSLSLCADQVCLHFGWSRATVYRLFEADGGLINYIQQRRLHRAFSALISRDRPGRRILDIALDCQFASDATFTRAFTRTFGIPPGELRALAKPSQADQQHQTEVEVSDDRLTVQWIRELAKKR